MSQYSTALIDIDGVLTQSWTAIDGATTAFGRLRDHGVRCALVTNTTSITRGEITRRLNDQGFAVDIDDVLTAPSLAAGLIGDRYPGRTCALVTSGDLGDDVAALDLVDLEDDPDVILLGGAGPEFSYDVLNRVFNAVNDGTPLVALHRNLFWRTDAGLQLDAGAYLTAIEVATGCDATVVGKPSPTCFETALQLTGSTPGETMMIGDDIDNDVLAAQTLGIRGVLVRTGKYSDRSLRDAPGDPHAVVDSFADVPGLFGIT